jgi:hypothetical protein
MLEIQRAANGSLSVILSPYHFTQLAHRQHPEHKGDLAEPDLAATGVAADAQGARLVILLLVELRLTGAKRVRL